MTLRNIRDSWLAVSSTKVSSVSGLFTEGEELNRGISTGTDADWKTTWEAVSITQKIWRERVFIPLIRPMESDIGHNDAWTSWALDVQTVTKSPRSESYESEQTGD